MPSEDLELNVETLWDDDELEQLENTLKSIDDEIADTGKGRNQVEVDVEAKATDAHGELIGIRSELEALDDEEATVDVEVNDFDSVVSEMVESGAADADTPDVFGDDDTSVVDELEAPQTLTPADQRLAKAVGSATADGRGPSGKRDFRRFDFGEGFFRKLTDEEIDVRFESAFDTQDVSEELGLLDSFTKDDAPQFREISVGGFGGAGIDPERIETSETLNADDVDIDVTDANLEAAESIAGSANQGIRPSVDEDIGDDRLLDDTSFLDRLRGLDMPDDRDTSKMDDFMRSIVDARFSMENFHNIIAALIPVAALLIGALPAAITAIGGLAAAALAATAALGGIGLLGLAGMGLTTSGEIDIQPILNRLQSVFDTFVAEFTPLMTAFAPLVRGAFDDLEGMAAPLADAASALTLFKDEFRALSAGAADVIPQLVTDTLKFAHFAMPALKGFVSFISQINFFEGFANIIKQTLVPLVAIGESLTSIIPAVLKLSIGFLHLVAIFSTFAQAVAIVLNTLGPLTILLGALIGGIITVISVTTALSLALGALGINASAVVVSLTNLSLSSLYAAATLQAGTLAAVAFYSALTLGILGAVSFAAALDSLSQSLSLVNGKLGKFSELSSGDLSANVSGPGSPTGSGFGNSSGGNNYNINVSANSREQGNRTAKQVAYEIQHRDNIFSTN